MKWLIKKDEHQYQINFSSYSSLFVNCKTNPNNLIKPIIQYFQPRAKVKELLSVLDLINDFEEISSHSFTAIELSNELLKNETSLGAKTIAITYKH